MASHQVRTRVRVLFSSQGCRGSISVRHGQLEKLQSPGASATIRGRGFRAAKSPDGCCVIATILSEPLQAGAESPMVAVLQEGRQGFSFFLRDVQSECPILVRDLGVAITPEKDRRTYREIAQAVRDLGLQSKLHRIESEPEESFDNAAAHVRSLTCPTWLGLSRDVRTFEMGFEGPGQWDHYVAPLFHNLPVKLPELDNQPVRLNFMVGRGVGVTRDITRSLDEGHLPILHARIIDEDVHYDCTAFASLERSPLTEKNVAGTHFLVADTCQAGTALSAEQRKISDELSDSQLHRDEETVLYFRCVATNPAAVARHAFFRSAVAAKGNSWTAPPLPANGVFASSGRAYAIQKYNGQEMPQEEMAVLLLSGESCSFEFFLPHEPISARRAKALFKQDFDARLRECRAYWQEKLSRAGQVRLPERRIEEMFQAGLLHLDLITYGQRRGPLNACVGRYGPIGSESAPIIQCFESASWHEQAQRAIDYFLQKQRPDGFIQNFERYMLETGPVLWVVGEHFRYTQDKAWLRRVKPNILRACDYLMAWHKRNCREELKGRGYGLLEGKVGDPEDCYRTFMLNGYACLGMARAAEALQAIDPTASVRLAKDAAKLRQLVRKAFFENVTRSPVVPLSDGTWSPSAGPWAEATGPVCLYADVFNAYTHASAVARDSLIGAMHLIFQEVLASDEPAADWLMNLRAELLTQRNAAFSQPYYDPSLYAHLLRGEVKAFLKGYYNTVAGLADRQTYSFWEHLFHASPHKTHEEAWFLLQTRWMLYLEQKETLRLLSGVPRRWLADGQEIALSDMVSQFGRLSLHVRSQVSSGRITAKISCKGRRRPQRVEIRLPHPHGQRAVHASGGRYDEQRECVVIENFTGQAEVKLAFRV